jgi:hypothetical protein
LVEAQEKVPIPHSANGLAPSGAMCPGRPVYATIAIQNTAVRQFSSGPFVGSARDRNYPGSRRPICPRSMDYHRPPLESRCTPVQSSPRPAECSHRQSAHCCLVHSRGSYTTAKAQRSCTPECQSELHRTVSTSKSPRRSQTSVPQMPFKRNLFHSLTGRDGSAILLHASRNCAL